MKPSILSSMIGKSFFALFVAGVFLVAGISVVQVHSQNANVNGNANLNTNVNGNANLNTNLNVNGNANLNGNLNTNLNTNLNVNGNLNNNLNTNLNTNLNGNLNTNLNTNVNTNLNRNLNTNLNTNLNVNGNTNTNGNVFFRDVPRDTWYYVFIENIRTRCGVEGYRDAQGNLLFEYRPGNSISRAELVTIMVRCQVGAIVTPTTEKPFPDVPANHWAAAYIARAKLLGWIHGYPDGLFRPDQNINRVELTKVVLRSEFEPNEIVGGTMPFLDTDPTQWYAVYVRFAYMMGFVTGYLDADGHPTGYFKPANDASRAEAAKIIDKVVHRNGNTNGNINMNTNSGTVQIMNMSYQPSTITVPAGTTVTWVNRDAAQHTVSSTTNSFQSGVLSQNQAYSHTFTQPGTYNYFCALHPNMTGKVIVTGSSNQNINLNQNLNQNLNTNLNGNANGNQNTNTNS